MSADQMRKMLEQLMGPQDEQAANRHFSDSDVCRPFLLGICLHDLFTNTREDLGACSKIHSEAMRGDYEKASQKADYNMEEEVLEYLMDFISKNEKRIVSNKKRLEAEESPELEQKAKEIHEVGIQIGEKLAKAEALGNEGKVDESLAMMAEVEQLKRRRKQAEDDYRASLPLSSNQQQKLRACDVCGAFLSLYDNDRRLADHFGGKLHLGFVAIREKITELEEKIKAKVERRRSEREADHSSEDRRGSRRSGASRRSRSRDRDQDRDRVRDRDRDRERDRDKDRERERDRDRDRERRSHRSRSRERSRRTRSRSRDRDRHRRSRSRSRERRRRSRSRSRERRRRSRSQEEKSRHRRSRS